VESRTCLTANQPDRYIDDSQCNERRQCSRGRARAVTGRGVSITPVSLGGSYAGNVMKGHQQDHQDDQCQLPGEPDCREFIDFANLEGLTIEQLTDPDGRVSEG